MATTAPVAAEVSRTLAAERRRKNLMKPSQLQLSVGEKAFKSGVMRWKEG